MNKISKRIISLLMAAILTLSLGAAALAAGEVYATQVQMSETALTMYAGQTKDLDAYVGPTDYNQGEVWSSDKAAVATVDQSGAVTAVAIGAANITVAVKNSSGTTVTATCAVTVQADSIDSFVISGSGVSSGNATISGKGTLELTATTTYASGKTTTAANWTSSDLSVAGVSSTGVVTGVSAGTATITATSKSDNSQTAAVTVTVSDVAVGGVSPSAAKTILTVGQTTTVSANVYPSNAFYNENDIVWSSSDSAVATVSSSGVVTGVKAGSANIIATLGDKSGYAAITVNDNVVTSVTLSSSTVTMAPGDSASLSATLLPAGATYTSKSWSSANTSVATVNASTGVITGVAKGTAVITLTVTNPNGGTVTASCTVTVSDPTANVTDTTTGGTAITLSNIYSSLRSKFYSLYKVYPSTSSTFVINTLGNSNVGRLYTSASTSSYYYVKEGTSYSLSNVSSMYFRPSNAGTYVANYTLTNTDTAKSAMSGTITITVSSATSDVTVTLSSTDNYSFSSSDTDDGVSARANIYNTVKNATGETLAYIRFGSAPSSTYGTLYANSDEDSISTSTYYAYSSSSTYSIYKLYFVPNKAGTYSRTYYAYDSNKDQIATGTLQIVTDGSSSSSTTVTVNLDGKSAYSFSDTTSEDGTSAYSAISAKIKTASGSYYDYIKFGSVTSGSNVGTLYGTSDETTLSTSRAYYRDKNETYTVYDLYFVPSTSGTYVRSFTAYDSDGSKLVTGTLKIVVGSSTASGDLDIYYTTTPSTTIDLSESDFLKWYQSQTSSSYYLAYVTFDDRSDELGSFKNNSSSFVPGNEVSYYSSTYTGSKSSSAKYLSNCTYTSTSSTYVISVNFTCYGGTSTSKTSTSKSGTMYIAVTKNTVKDLSYQVKDGSTQKLSESDFLNVYQSALSSSSSSTKLYVKFLGVPASGKLYYNYTSSSSTGTALTSSNILSYSFYVNGSSSNKSLDDVTYVPASASSGSYSIKYAAYNSSGTLVYIGTLTFNLSASSKTMTCYAEGYTFKVSEFYATTDSNPITYLTFTQPSTGVLYANYANGSGTAVTSATKFYTVYSNYGTYAISALSYIPKAGYTGNVSIGYTAYTSSGSSYTGTITMVVKSKTASSQFTDVTAAGSGSWSAGSVDYAYKWGLVNGTGTYTFAPDSTMTRAMLVTILYRAAGSPSVTGTCPFTDVKSGAYYYNAVIWANKNGIVSGLSSTSFGPDNNVTREQVAAFLYRYAKFKGMSTTASGSLASYTDVSKVSSWAKDALTWCVGKGYITSSSSSALTLTPTDSATRAQVSVMLHRFLTF